MSIGHSTARPRPALSDEVSTPVETPTLFEDFFRDQQRTLLAFLRRRTGNDQDAQDLLQDSYLRMVRFGYGEPPRPVPVWRALLYRTAASLAANLGREQRQRHIGAHESIDDVELISDQPSPERQLEQAQELAAMVAALRDLPPRCRQVFILHRLRDRSYAEIALECEISVKAVEKHISRALAAFRARVGSGRQGVSP